MIGGWWWLVVRNKKTTCKTIKTSINTTTWFPIFLVPCSNFNDSNASNMSIHGTSVSIGPACMPKIRFNSLSASLVQNCTLQRLTSNVKGKTTTPYKYRVKYASFFLDGSNVSVLFILDITNVCHESNIIACKKENNTTVYNNAIENKNNATKELLTTDCIKCFMNILKESSLNINLATATNTFVKCDLAI